MSYLKKMSPEDETIARRAAAELNDGELVNLGIGLPTFVARVLPPGVSVVFHSENGFVGMGAPLEDGTPDSPVIDAGGRACSLLPGAACFDSAMSFSIVRGGHLDVAILGAFEVSLAGDLANWMIPGRLTPGMGGGMELAQKARRVIVVSRHLDKHGRGKLVPACTLPLTARSCVSTLITERAVFRRLGGVMRLVAIHPAHSVESALEGMPSGLGLVGNLEHWEKV
jgi:3-oxoacid CoA-transferase B subunit